jgi:hypothetical protein
MNSRLILQLSMFGLAMGLATVYFIPSNIEPAFWLAIFLVSAYVIARACATKRFLHGFLLGLANCVWITGSHVLLAGTYLANHAKEAEMMKQMPISASPQLLMLITGPIVGIVSGIVIGLLALLAGTMVKPKSVAAAA